MGHAFPFAGQIYARRDIPANLRFIRSIALQCVGNLVELALGSGIQPTERSGLEPPSKHARDNVSRTNGGRVFPKVVGPGPTQLFNRKLCKGRNLDKERAAMLAADHRIWGDSALLILSIVSGRRMDIRRPFLIRQ